MFADMPLSTVILKGHPPVDNANTSAPPQTNVADSHYEGYAVDRDRGARHPASLTQLQWCVPPDAQAIWHSPFRWLTSDLFDGQEHDETIRSVYV